MNWFKRLCLFVFGLCGLLALAALSLVWVGPWTSQARTLLLEEPWYFLTLEILVCVSAVGLLACLLVSLFAPRNPRETIVADVNGGQITVTRAAIVSQTRHVVEADGSCTASTIRVRVRKRGHVRVHVRVTPKYPVDVVECGEQLYAKLGEGLAQVCGQSVQSIDVVFTEPESAEGGHGFGRAEHAGVEGADVSVPMTSQAFVNEATPVVVPMSSPAETHGEDAESWALSDVAAESYEPMGNPEASDQDAGEV